MMSFRYGPEDELELLDKIKRDEKGYRINPIENRFHMHQGLIKNLQTKLDEMSERQRRESEELSTALQETIKQLNELEERITGY